MRSAYSPLRPTIYAIPTFPTIHTIAADPSNCLGTIMTSVRVRVARLAVAPLPLATVSLQAIRVDQGAAIVMR